jgi:hypothetical protein
MHVTGRGQARWGLCGNGEKAITELLRSYVGRRTEVDCN